MISLPIFIFLTVVYIMFVHMAMVKRKEFHLFITVCLFIFGGIVGHYLGAYMAGFVFAMVMDIIFWTHTEL